MTIFVWSFQTKNNNFVMTLQMHTIVVFCFLEKKKKKKVFFSVFLISFLGQSLATDVSLSVINQILFWKFYNSLLSTGPWQALSHIQYNDLTNLLKQVECWFLEKNNFVFTNHKTAIWKAHIRPLRVENEWQR